MQTRRTFLRQGAATLAAGVAMPAIARFSPALAAYPDRPVKLLVPFGPGGPVDVIARLIADAMGRELGGSVVVENRPGATGNLGVGVAARSDPDGYTVLVTSNTIVINPLLFTSVPYDIERDFQPLVDLAGSPTGFAAQNKLGASTLAEFVAQAKASGKFSYSHAGYGTPAHLAGEFFKKRAGFDMAAVSHNGAGPAAQALLSNSVEFASGALPALHPHIAAGTVKGLAVTGEKRWFDLPNVPTVQESGYPGFVLDTWTMMLVPIKTAPEIADKLSKAALAALQPPEVRARLRTVGFEATGVGPAQLKARIAREVPLWREVANVAGIKPVAPK